MAAIDYQRNEDKIIDEIKEYVDSTYSAHYSGQVQVLDVWDSLGLSKEAYKTNIIKFAMRAGRKGNQERQDVMKIIHYCLFLINEIDKEKQ